MTDASPDIAPSVFDLPPDLVYLNCAGQTPRLLAALDAGALALRRSAQPWSESMDDWRARPERVRTLAAAVIGCDAEGLALVPSVAYGMALAAHCLPMKPGQIVLTLSGEHPSAINVWQVAAHRQQAELRQVQITDHGDWTGSLLAAINARVAVVVTPACHWHNGRRIDLARIARATRAQGAALVIDATQALGVLDLDLAALDADFVIAAGHKWLLGGAGLSYACIAERHRQTRPLEESAWARVGGLAGGIHDGQLPAYVAGAARFDGSGIYSHPALMMAEVGLAQLQEWRIANVRAQLQQWQRSLLSISPAQGLADWRVISDSPHLMSFQPPGAGERICQEIVLRLLDQKLVAAALGDGIRISPYLHSSTEDATRLCVALAHAWVHVKR